MTEKNPYENQETVDIPDFPSIKSDTEDIDRSVFKMDDDFNEDEYDEDEYDEEPTYRKLRQPVIVATAIIMAVLLGLSIFGIVYGLGKKKEYNTLKEEYDAYVSRATANESSLNAQIAALQAQISQPTNEEGSKEGAGNYRVVVDAINVRKEASTTSDALGVLNNDDTVKVIETTKDSSGNLWGKIDFNGQTGYFCIKLGSDTLAELKAD